MTLAEIMAKSSAVASLGVRVQQGHMQMEISRVGLRVCSVK